MRCTIQCAICSSWLTLLASPDSAGGDLGRARVVSRRGVMFSGSFHINCSNLKYLFVRIDTYQSECKYVRDWVVKQAAPFPCVFQVDVSNPGQPFLFSCAIFFHFSCCLALAPCVVSQPSSSRTWYKLYRYLVPGTRYVYVYRVLLPLPLLLLLFVIVCQMAKFVGSLNLILLNSVLFLFIQTRFNFNVLLGSTIAFTASICLCTSSVITGMRRARRASAHRDEAPLCVINIMLGFLQQYILVKVGRELLEIFVVF